MQGFKDRAGESKEKILSICKVFHRRTHESWEVVNEITREVIEVIETVLNQAKSEAEKIIGKV